MGRDRMAVVDPQLRVHGIEGLRVADASIMPTVVSGNTNAACIMIGEKAADLVRGQVLAAREREFVEAARALGATDARILLRHILPNIIQPVIVQAAIGMAGAILAEATMSFLGLGVPPPTPSWGTMLNDSRAHLFDAPHLVLFPAVTVMLSVLSFNFIGDGLRDLLDPRSRIEAGL